MMIIKSIFIFITTVSLINAITGEWKQYVNHNDINSLFLQEDTLWVGTNHDIVRWNLRDTTYSIYNKDDGVEPGRLDEILQDSLGNIWFLTAPFRAIKYNNGSFNSINILSGNSYSNPRSVINQNSGELWISENKNGFFKWNGTEFIKPENLMNINHVFWFGFDSTGIIHILQKDSSSIYFLNENNFTIKNFSDSLNIPNLSIYTFEINNNNEIWLETYTNGLIFIGENGVKSFINNDSDTSNLSINIPANKTSLNGDIYYLTRKDTSYNITYINKNSSKDSLVYSQSEPIECYYPVDRNTFWISGQNSLKLVNTDGMVKLELKVPDELCGTINDPYENLHITNNNISVNLKYGGLCDYSQIDGWTYYQDSLIATSILYSVTSDNNGNRWFTSSNGIIQLNHSKESSVVRNLQYSNFRTSLVDANNNIWVAGQSYAMVNDILVKNPYIACYNGVGDPLDGSNWIVYDTATHPEIFNNSSQGNFVSSALDVDSSVWFASIQNGLYHYNDNTWTKYDTSNGIPSNNIYKIKINDGGEHWIHVKTSLNKSALYKRNGLTWEEITIPDTLVNDFDFDKKGNLWLATSNGAFVFHNESWIKFDKDNGLTANKCTELKVAKNGDVWIINYNGICCFSSEELASKIKSAFKNKNIINEGQKHFTISIPQGINGVFEIFNLKGQLIKNYQLTDKTKRIEKPKVVGFYIYSLKVNKKVIEKNKFITQF